MYLSVFYKILLSFFIVLGFLSCSSLGNNNTLKGSCDYNNNTFYQDFCVEYYGSIFNALLIETDCEEQGANFNLGECADRITAQYSCLCNEDTSEEYEVVLDGVFDRTSAEKACPLLLDGSDDISVSGDCKVLEINN